MEVDRKAEEATSRDSESAEPAENLAGKLPRVKVTYEISEGTPVLIESIDMAISGTIKGVTGRPFWQTLALKSARCSK